MNRLPLLNLMILALAAMLAACSASRSGVAVPELLPRNAAIGSAEEQVRMITVYGELKQAIEANPKDYRRRLQLAQLFMLEARATGEHGHYYPAAIQVLDAILAEKPAQDIVFGAVSLKASVLLSLHQFDEARKLAEYAVSLNGYNALIYGSLVDAQVELGNYEAAVQMCDKMMSIRPDLRSYSRVSYLRELHGDLPGAIEAMKMAAESGLPGYEETAWCRLNLGGLYERQGKLDLARAEYERILAERPKYPFAIAALAGIEQKEGHPELAEQRLKAAMDIIPEVGFYADLAGLYQQTGRTEEAGRLTRTVLEMLADDEAKGHMMGLEYAQVHLDLTGDYAKALEYARKEYERRPGNIGVNQLMAAIYLKMNNLPAAKQHLETAMRTRSSDPELLCIAGIASLRDSQPAKGLELLGAAFELDPYQDHAFADEARSYASK
ncbi:MAG: tetratricopeptide repeat protein [Bacteroidia bacterium]|nr:tetratricopeptide repeat protein [Bacteroidia bacterium]